MKMGPKARRECFFFRCKIWLHLKLIMSIEKNKIAVEIWRALCKKYGLSAGNPGKGVFTASFAAGKNLRRDIALVHL